MMTPEQLAGIRSRAADFYLSYRESGGELHAAVDDVNALLADRAELEADLRTVIAAWDRRANTPGHIPPFTVDQEAVAAAAKLKDG